MDIINGYPDGSFKPEKQVTYGEFLKMLAMTLYTEDQPRPTAPGEHWARQYADELNGILTLSRLYSDAKLDQVISRGDMAVLVAAYHQFIHSSTIEFDRTFVSIDRMKDKDRIPEEYWGGIDHCIKHGIISGFEDSIFRYSEGLTGAQAAKVLCLA